MAKRRKEIFLLSMLLSGLLLCIMMVSTAFSAISLSVDPASAPANTTTGFTFQTQAATAGGTVQFELFADFNGNGIIDGDEWSLFTQLIADNGAAGDSGPLTPDSNPSSPNITTVFNPSGGGNAYLPAGTAIMRVINSLGETATVPFTMTPAYAAQTVSGKVYIQGTTTPVAFAVVMCSDPVTEAFISATFADNNGSYILQIPTPQDIEIETFKEGYIETENNIIDVPSTGISNYNLYLILPDAQITGTVREYGTGSPLWGVEVDAETLDGKKSWTFTNFTGNFSLPVLSGMEWIVAADGPPGYFGMRASSHNYMQYPIITPTFTGPNIVNFVAHKETAWIEGTVKDEYGTNVVEGALFYANRINTSDPALQTLSNGHYTNNLGQVTVGLEAGDWRAGLCMNCHEQPVLVGGVQKEMVPPAEVDVLNLTAGEHRPITLQAYYADGAIEGRVYREDGITPAPGGVRVWASTDNALNGPGQTSVGYIYTQTDTDDNGFFRLPLLGGTWTVGASMFDWNKQSNTQVITLITNGNDMIDLPSETITGIPLVLNLPIYVNLSVAKAGTGSGTVTSGDGLINCGIDCSETYYSNTTVTLTATPDVGSTFTGWSGACSGTGTCTVTMDADKTVTATFTKTHFEEDDPAITYTGTWNTYTSVCFSGGALKYSNDKTTPAKAEFSFNGTGIKWIVTRAKMMGKAKVYLDGVYMGMVDLYSPTIKCQVVLQKTGLTPVSHTLTIEVSGQKNPSSTGYYIDIDAFEVMP